MNEETTIHTLQVNSVGVVISIDAQIITEGMQPNLSDCDVVVPEFLYTQVLSGMDEGYQYKFLHGDLICEGPNATRLRFESKEKIRQAFYCASKEIRIAGKKDVVVYLNEVDISLMSAACLLKEDFFLPTSEGSMLFEPKRIKQVLSQAVDQHNRLSLDMKRTFDLLDKTSERSEISIITERAVRRMRRVV